jgi:hypothetical protein
MTAHQTSARAKLEAWLKVLDVLLSPLGDPRMVEVIELKILRRSVF